MVKVTETTREEVEKVLENLGWVLNFWNEKMTIIARESLMDREHFLGARDIGIKFMENFVIPVAEVYEGKLQGFPVENAKEIEEDDVEVNPGNSSEPVVDGYLSRIPGKRGRKPGSKNKPKIKNDGDLSDLPVPESLAPESTPTAPVPSVPVVDAPGKVTYAYRRSKTKYTKDGGLSKEQRDQITNRWIEHKGVMTDAQCSDLSKEMGFSGPEQVKGWVSYLTKVCNNNPTYVGRAKGWTWMIKSDKISDKPVPGFFHDKVEVAFTTRPKAVV